MGEEKKTNLEVQFGFRFGLKWSWSLALALLFFPPFGFALLPNIFWIYFRIQRPLSASWHSVPTLKCYNNQSMTQTIIKTENSSMCNETREKLTSLGSAHALKTHEMKANYYASKPETFTDIYIMKTALRNVVLCMMKSRMQQLP